MQKQVNYIIKGMNRDTSIGVVSNEFSFDNRNIRITARDNNTLLSITNERGNLPLSIDNLKQQIEGTVIGYCVLNDYLILFTHSSSKDYIYRLKFKDNTTLECTTLYSESLNFSTDNPIEAIGLYENENIQKVYWVDGINQPRMINIMKEDYQNYIHSDGSSPFDFVQVISDTHPKVEITKESVSNGIFASGVIQYSFSYINEYGQESCIFYTSPLYYLTYNERGGSPESRIGNAFKIKLSLLDTSFDYVRIYSTVRTSIDATPETKRVIDLPTTSGTVYYTDNGTVGDTISPTELLYIGGEIITPSTICHKDNTLFLGDITLQNTEEVIQDFEDSIRRAVGLFINSNNKSIPKDETNTTYSYNFQLNKSQRDITTFKKFECYRLGVQLKDKYGKWSRPIWYKDERNTIGPVEGDDAIYLTEYQLTWNDLKVINQLREAGFIAVRPLVVFPTENNRECICQGVVNPTVFNVEDRASNSPYAQASWFFRPDKKNNDSGTIDTTLDYYVSERVTVGLNEIVDYKIVREALEDTIYRSGFTVYVRGGNIHYEGNNGVGLDTSGNVKEANVDFAGFMLDENLPTFIIGFKAVRPYVTQAPILNESYFIGIDKDLLETLIRARSNNEITVDLSIRPVIYMGQTSLIGSSNIGGNQGVLVEYKHFHPIPTNSSLSAEIQNICNPKEYPSSTEETKTEYIGNHKQDFYIDRNVVTLNSPDLEFNTNLENIDLSNAKFRLVGIIPLTAFKGDINITTSTPPLNYQGTTVTPIGFYKEPVYINNKSTAGCRVLASGIFWMDEVADNDRLGGDGAKNVNLRTTGFVVYPWNRSGSLNNSTTEEGYRSSILQYKKISNLRFSENSVYFTEGEVNNLMNNIVYTDNFDSPWAITVATSSEMQPTLFGINKHIYYSNIDKISTTGGTKEWSNGKSIMGYPLVIASNGKNNPTLHELFTSPYREMNNYDSGETDETYWRVTSTDPVSIKYKSTPHAIIQFPYGELHGYVYLPYTYNHSTASSATVPSGETYFWSGLYKSTQGPGTTATTSYDNYGCLWIGELYNPINSNNISDRFGGISEEALQNNQWQVAGEEVLLTNSVTLRWTEGDTYYQRYDCLKTYPFTLEDTNSIVEILSFMVETRINIDGRYDKNRGSNSLVATPDNYNLINPVYSQTNNFFTYRVLNEDSYTLNSFPTTITWSLEKSLGERVDSWTNITMSSILELDGDKGKINSLKVFNNEIFCFQDTGLSNILFNNRVQIPTSDGVPIEITNGMKVQGKRYISNTIGCNNKWSICESPYGIYYVDNISTDIYFFNGQLTSLADKLGFKQWISTRSKLDKWDPVNFNNFRTYYDKTNGDVYFTDKEDCLVYSEKLGQFTSFMDYNRVPYMFNFKDRFLSIKDSKLWHQEAGEYNYFFGEFRPFFITYRVNPDMPLDKTFNNIEFRADTWDGDTLTDITFDTLEVWNEYQYGKSDLKKLFKPSNLKKKFRIWGAFIPRDEANHRDRIRNPWIYLKLSMNEVNNYRTEFHDLIVRYFE